MGAPPPLSVVLKDASEPLCVRRISPPQAGPEQGSLHLLQLRLTLRRSPV